MDYTLVELYDGSINNVYHLTFPLDMDADDLGLVYFAYYCNDLDSYNGEGHPFERKKQQSKDLRKDYYSDCVRQLAQDEQTTVEDIYWMKWCLDRCSSDPLEDIPELVSDEMQKYNTKIVSYYTWGLEDGERSSEIMDGNVVGILLEGKVDIDEDCS